MLFSSQSTPPATILIVDDELANLLLLEEALKELGSIITTQDGEEALLLAEQHRPEVILLDIEMPGMGGFEVCKRLKRSPNTCNSAVIFVTSHSASEFEYQSLSYGGVDFLSKPIDFRLCQLRVRSQLTLVQQANALRTAKEELHDLVTHLPVFISYWSPDWRNLYSNDFAGQWFEKGAQSMKGKEAIEVLPPELWRQLPLHGVHSETTSLVSVHLDSPIQGAEDLQAYISPRFEKEDVCGYLLTLVDVTDIKRAKRELSAEKERLKVTLSSIGDAVIATDLEGCISFMNPIAERMTGWLLREAEGEHIETVMNLRDADTQMRGLNPAILALNEKRIVAMALNSQLTSRDGTVYRVEDSAAPIKDELGQVIGAIMVFHDISESIAMAVKMSYLANHDQLTDLPNRILLHDRLSQACKTAKNKGRLVALFLIDIDHFKYLNDSLGHHHGDVLIKQVAKRLESLIDTDSTLARIGGDEFVLVIPEIDSPGVIDSMAQAIIRCMEEPFRLEGKEYQLSVSVGISVNPTDSESEESMMRYADVAMYRAKQQGRNRYCFFSEDLEAELMRRHDIEMLLRHAIDQDGFEVFFQPQFALRNMALIGAEALVRLRDKDGNFISPADFIPLAEETGLINQLGRQVLRKSCLAAKGWQRYGKELRVAVNIAAKQFSNPAFIDEVAAALEESELRSHLLELEVTESALMLDFDQAQSTLVKLSALGLSIAIDDFGTGYSSLSYLKLFPVDVLKIDQSFVRDMLDDGQSLDIVRTIVHLAKSLNLTLVGEGVEREPQKQTLLELGCDLGQGFLFARPLPADEFERLLVG
ncbi:EAL domain-containing protein [Shewanella cyperi]|uniref:EAL domain-containing protein n=1 Tax=Shewanella cyperi TaxID=2814292 RepID=A0A974XLD9_9GAMM|nr:EAL domain-containing protein [Shewanella cyperi]QSX30464.1 EAL domain-containing protein [Shewanella cyperi]